MPQAWAEATGAYVPGRDKPDLPTWKRNFRSALNRKDVCLAEDRSKDPHDPHKIYEFVNSGLPDRGSCGRLGSQGFLAPLLPSPPFSTGVGDFSQPDYSPDTNGGGSTSDTQVRMCPTFMPLSLCRVPMGLVLSLWTIPPLPCLQPAPYLSQCWPRLFLLQSPQEKIPSFHPAFKALAHLPRISWTSAGGCQPLGN